LAIKNNSISDVWLKAAVLGATWAASEIILGSFLHNLHIPFKGSILTSIGLILLIAVSFKWKDKGLFWRSGLICALMKTMSPSAVIFGPMVAIFMESLLLEFSSRFFGRNMLGFALGGVLAMSWIFFQKIINYLIFYGMDIVDIYANILKYAEKQLDIHTDIFWLPIFILLGIYILFGLLATFAAINIGKKLISTPIRVTEKNTGKPFELNRGKALTFDYSIRWLIINFAALVTGLVLLSNYKIYIWAPYILIVISVWVLRYKRGMRQLSRPKFWIFFVIITILSAVLISSLSGEAGIWLQGLLTGIQMNFRAALVIVGFTVLGTELYNPKIRKALSKSSFKQLAPALELAFQSLPFIISNLPDAKNFVKKPLKAVKQLISSAEQGFEDLRQNISPGVFIIEGDIASGKTSILKKLIKKLKEENISIGGFYSPRIVKKGETIGYDLVSVETQDVCSFLRLKKNVSDEGIGKYVIDDICIRLAESWLDKDISAGKDIIVIDEIGRLELKGKGWDSSLRKLLSTDGLIVLITVRSEFAEQVKKHYSTINALSFKALEVNINKLSAEIKKTKTIKKTETVN
jgi:nucleoside-triphosphatase THEP1